MRSLVTFLLAASYVVAAIANCEAASFDCNGDGRIDADDFTCVTSLEARDHLLAKHHLLLGDLDFSGGVNFADFQTLSTNFGDPSKNKYTDGDFDLDGGPQFADFQTLSVNFGKGGVCGACGDCVLTWSDMDCVSTIEERDVVLNVSNTLPGDLNGNGTVDFADFQVISVNFGDNTKVKYTEGDIDLQNGPTFVDFQILSVNFGKTPQGAAMSVPEPAGLWLFGVGVIVLLKQRRRLRR